VQTKFTIKLIHWGVAELGETTDLTYVKRVVDERSLDEKVYKIRAVIPKEPFCSKRS
jgi:hypothetical protein